MMMLYAAIVLTLFALCLFGRSLYDVIHVAYLRWAVNREMKKIASVLHSQLQRDGYLVFPDRRSQLEGAATAQDKTARRMH